jgi:hydrogenase small subunit
LVKKEEVILMAQEIPVLWLAASSCTGCSVSLLNSASPSIKNVLVDEVIPGVHINLRFHQTVMAGSGEQAIQVLEDTRKEKKGGYVLVVDGSIPSGDTVGYCVMGERDGKPVNLEERFVELAQDALVILAVGTCSSFGGIPAAAPNPSNARPLSEILKEKGIPTAADLDDNLRPLAYYGKLIHENCPRRAYFDEGKFAKKPGDEGCLFELGCKGPITYADCPTRRWNNGTNWVIGAGSPCHGCTQPEFPNLPMYQKLEDVELPVVGAYWTGEKEDK